MTHRRASDQTYAIFGCSQGAILGLRVLWNKLREYWWIFWGEKSDLQYMYT